MRALQSQLQKTLLDKTEILLDLIMGQEKMKAFLVSPQWESYFTLLQPQQELLAKLRENVRAQRTISMKMAQSFGLNARTPMIKLLPLMPPEVQEELVPLFELSRHQAEKLNTLSQLSRRLFEAQNQFTQHWVESWKDQKPNSLAMYDSFGYHVPKSNISVFQQDA